MENEGLCITSISLPYQAFLGLSVFSVQIQFASSLKVLKVRSARL
jgi:hypothetical protein